MHHKCNICNKEFKRIYELERHKIRINKCKPNNIDVNMDVNIVPPKNPPNPPKLLNNNKIIRDNIEINPPNPPNYNLVPPNNLQNNIDNNDRLICNNCDKTFARSDNLKKHINGRCRGKQIEENIDNNDDIIVSNEIFKKINNMNEEITELKNTILKLEQKASIINNNNIINNTMNITNNINIIKFGTEKPTEKLTTKEAQYIVNSHINSIIQKSIEITHFNNKHPEYQNIYIPDKKMQYAYIFTGNKFELIKVNNVLGELVNTHTDNLDDLINREDISITEHKKKQIDDLVDNFDKYCEKGSDNQKKMHDRVFNELKLMLYNNKDKVIENKNRVKIARKKKL